MKRERIIELLEIEHECMLRGSRNECDRQCEKCELVQKDSDLNEMYIEAINIVKEHDLSHEDFIDWLACCVFEDDWEENPGFYREVIMRKLVRMGYVEKKDDNYELKETYRRDW